MLRLIDGVGAAVGSDRLASSQMKAALPPDGNVENAGRPHPAADVFGQISHARGMP